MQMLRLISSLSLGLAITLTGSAATWAASPSLGVILPRGLQRGATSVLTFHGGNLADAKEILFFSPGFRSHEARAEPRRCQGDDQGRERLPLGEHVAHVRTASGLTEYRTFYVGPFPDIKEKEPNSDFKSPQPIPHERDRQRRDRYRGRRLLRCRRQKGPADQRRDRGHAAGRHDVRPVYRDSRLQAIRADHGRRLAALEAGRGLASIIAPADGKYIIQVRESSYGGDGNCHYRLHVGNFPRPIADLPGRRQTRRGG